MSTVDPGSKIEPQNITTPIRLTRRFSSLIAIRMSLAAFSSAGCKLISNWHDCSGQNLCQQRLLSTGTIIADISLHAKKYAKVIIIVTCSNYRGELVAVIARKICSASFIQQKRGVSMKKKALLLALALAGSTSAHAQTASPPEPAREDTNDAIKPVNAVAGEVDKLKIIESLQAIKKDPTTVKFHSAMCYDMAMPPAYTTFSCPTCGTETQYHTQSYQGEVANRIAYLSRSLGQIKAKTTVDFSDFCSKCSKDSDDQPELKLTASCIDCGKSFSWTANTIKELEQLPLLFTDFPVTEVDQGHIGEQKIEPEKLSEYLSNRLLCPACREKHGLK